MRRKVTRSVFMAIAGVAVCAIPTTATAHGGNNDPNAVHACIGNVSKVVRIVGAGDNCLSSPPLVAETPAHWSIKGPQGPQGLQGVQGQQGQQGMPGTNGTNGIDGTSVTFAGYFTGNQNGCPNGGVIFAAGEPAVNAYVCNGANGTNGTDGQEGTNGGRAAPPCFDNTNRYVDCGNGTVTDTDTGLIWLRDAGCLGSADWAAANGTAAALADGQCGLTDGSAPGDWRLPTREEWSATISTAVAMNCIGSRVPSLASESGYECVSDGGSPFLGVPLDPSNEFSNVLNFTFWSSTGAPMNSARAGYVNLYFGGTDNSAKSNIFRLWPVRGGSR